VFTNSWFQGGETADKYRIRIKKTAGPGKNGDELIGDAEED
jgi:hypothetical protein